MKLIIALTLLITFNLNAMTFKTFYGTDDLSGKTVKIEIIGYKDYIGIKINRLLFLTDYDNFIKSIKNDRFNYDYQISVNDNFTEPIKVMFIHDFKTSLSQIVITTDFNRAMFQDLRFTFNTRNIREFINVHQKK